MGCTIVYSAFCVQYQIQLQSCNEHICTRVRSQQLYCGSYYVIFIHSYVCNIIKYNTVLRVGDIDISDIVLCKAVQFIIHIIIPIDHTCTCM